MSSPLNAAVYECPERRAQGPVLLQASGPKGQFVAQRAANGTWSRLAEMPSTLAPAWAEVKDDLAREVLYIGAVAALWPGLDPWPFAAKPTAR